MRAVRSPIRRSARHEECGAGGPSFLTLGARSESPIATVRAEPLVCKGPRFQISRNICAIIVVCLNQPKHSFVAACASWRTAWARQRKGSRPPSETITLASGGSAVARRLQRAKQRSPPRWRFNRPTRRRATNPLKPRFNLPARKQPKELRPFRSLLKPATATPPRSENYADALRIAERLNELLGNASAESP